MIGGGERIEPSRRRLESEVLPVRKDGIFFGEESYPVSGMYQMIRGHGPVVYHDQLDPFGPDCQALQQVPQGDGLFQFQAGRGAPVFPCLSSQRPVPNDFGGGFHVTCFSG